MTLALNHELEGKRYPVVSFTVERDHVLRFASAVGDDGSFVPPTFLTVPELAAGLARAMVDEELGLDFSRVVHGEEEYVWARPPRIGETLDVETTIESIRVKRGHGFLTLRTEMRDAGGEPLVTARSSLVVRGSA
jgi:hypothetical protein